MTLTPTPIMRSLLSISLAGNLGAIKHISKPVLGATQIPPFQIKNAAAFLSLISHGSEFKCSVSYKLVSQNVNSIPLLFKVRGGEWKRYTLNRQNQHCAERSSVWQWHKEVSWRAALWVFLISLKHGKGRNLMKIEFDNAFIMCKPSLVNQKKKKVLSLVI